MALEDIEHDLHTTINELSTSCDELEILGYLETLNKIISNNWSSDFEDILLTKNLIYRYNAILNLDNKLTK